MIILYREKWSKINSLPGFLNAVSCLSTVKEIKGLRKEGENKDMNLYIVNAFKGTPTPREISNHTIKLNIQSILDI